jgi:hypothetical protein
MHVYKLEAEKIQLSKEFKTANEKNAEIEAKLKVNMAKLQDGNLPFFSSFHPTHKTTEKQERSIKLTAQRDDLKQQLDLLEHNHKAIVKEKEERILLLEYQVKVGTYQLSHSYIDIIFVAFTRRKCYEDNHHPKTTGTTFTTKLSPRDPPPRYTTPRRPTKLLLGK